jgi:O-acetyl-ADP-ribose deacetylase (regulator of RNase III)
VIFNLMTQEPALTQNAHPGKATAHNVNHALRDLRGIIEKEALTSVALPRLASGVGGLDWGEVEPLIAQILGDLSISVIVYESYEKVNAAAENL